MKFSRYFLILFAASAGLAFAEDLPLPKDGPAPMREGGLLKPTVVIKPPSSGSAAKPDSANELAILEIERTIIEEQTHKLIADAALKGNATALKQLILMSGPVDPSISRAAKPPASEGKLAVIGLTKSEGMSKGVEHFFGASMTPESEKALLEAVSNHLAGKGNAQVEVKVAGWWPNEGVLAMSVMPRG